MPRGHHNSKTLPQSVRLELDQRLVEGNFTNYDELAKWLGDHGCAINPPIVRNGGAKLETRLGLVKLATEQAQAAVEATPDNDEQMSEALMRLVQQNLFAVLIELEPDGLRGTNLHAVARTVAQLGRVVISLREHTVQTRARIADRARTASEEVVRQVRRAGGGLSPEAERDIRNALMAITQ